MLPFSWSKAPSLDIRKRRLIRRNHSRARSSLNAHVAERHPPFHREPSNRFARIFDNVSSSAISADLPTDPQRQVLCSYTFRQSSADADQHRFRLALRQTLRGQHVLDLRGPNPKCQRSKSAMRTGMAVATNNRHSRLRQSKFRPDDVDDTLLRRIHIKQRHFEFFTVLLQGLNLPGSDRISDGCASRRGRDVVIHGRDRAMWLANFAPSRPQPIKCLRRSNFMHQVQVDVQQRQPPCRRGYHVLIPNFFEKCAFFGHTSMNDRGLRPVFMPQDSLPTKTSVGPLPVRARALHFRCSSLVAAGYHSYSHPSSRVIAPDRFKGNGMLNGKRIAVVLPAYNAEKTLEATVRELPDLVDIRILVDDHSSDRTVEVAHQLGLQFYVHDQNYG